MADVASLARRWFEEVWNQKRENAIDELFAADGIAHGLADEQKPLPGPGAFKAFWNKFVSAFPDLHIHVHDVISQDDKAALRFSFSGTHRGDDLGIPATGRRVNVTGLTLIRTSKGQIVEGWNEFDVMSMLQQLGAAPGASPREKP